MTQPGRGCTDAPWVVGLDRPDPTTVVLRPEGRLDGSTAVSLRRQLLDGIVYHAYVVLDLTRVVSGDALAASLVAEARRFARESHVTLTVLGVAVPRGRSRAVTVGY